MRLEGTHYRERFVIKGGLLLSSMMGVAQRTTMDLDATVRAMTLNEETVSAAMQEICSVDLHDGIAFAFERVEPIREDDDYGGLRAHLVAEFGRMRTPLKVDVTTGDVITPREVAYEFPTLFGEKPIHLLSYPLETCIAEKFEAVVKRGTATTRARDLYAIATLVRLYEPAIDWGTLCEAVRRTSEHRGSSDMMKHYELVSREIEGSNEIESTPDPLTSRFPFRHDGRNGGKRGGPWAIHLPGTRRNSSRRPLSCTGNRARRTPRWRAGWACDAGSLADWVKKADAAGPASDADPFQMAEDLRRLKRENERLKRENEILLKASAFFASRQL